MLIQKEIVNTELANVLQNIGERELLIALEPFLKKRSSPLIKKGNRRPFKPFNPINMEGDGLTASEMVVQDRT